jgi:hypothetical protein
MVEELGVQVNIWVFYKLIKVPVELLEPGDGYRGRRHSSNQTA